MLHFLPQALAVYLKSNLPWLCQIKAGGKFTKKNRVFLAHTLPLKSPLPWRQSARASVDHRRQSWPFGLQGPNVSGNECGLWTTGTFSWSFGHMMNMIPLFAL